MGLVAVMGGVLVFGLCLLVLAVMLLLSVVFWGSNTLYQRGIKFIAPRAP